MALPIYPAPPVTSIFIPSSKLSTDYKLFDNLIKFINTQILSFTMKGSHKKLVFIFLLVLVARLFFAFSTPTFTGDEAYYNPETKNQALYLF